MYCHFCGHEILDQSKFCSFCGRSQENRPTRSPNFYPALCCIAGAFFILCGILPYFLSGDIEAYNLFLNKQRFSTAEHAAFVCLNNFLIYLAPLFYFFSSAISVYSGILLLKKETQQSTPFLFLTIAHGASILYFAITNLLIYCAPGFVVSLFTSDGNIIAAGKNLLNNVPDLLYHNRNQALLRLVVSLAVVALSVALLIIRKRSVQSISAKSGKHAPVGVILMLLSFSIISLLSRILSNTLVATYDEYSLIGYSFAKSAFSNSVGIAASIVLFLVLFLAVFFTKQKRWILSIPTTIVLLILGLVALLFASELLMKQGAPAEYLFPAKKVLEGIIFNRVAVLIALFFWFSAVSRNRIPLWLQIVLPTSLPIFFVLFETILRVTLNLPLEVPLGIPFFSIITLILSLFVRTKKTGNNLT